MTTLQIINNMIVINLPETPDDYDNGEKQKLILNISHLGGFNINYTCRSITLFLTLKGKPKTTEHNLNVMSSKYHTTPGKSGERYILKNEHGYYVRINNNKYGLFGKQFTELKDAIKARDDFINIK
jgi:archaellum component FlaG (FlaF/FlaG flagellin family)